MNAFLFDVDGVLNTMENRTMSKPEIIVHLITLLQKGMPLGFISGRGLLWLRTDLIKVLEKYVDEHPTLAKSILDLVYVSGEFGGVTDIHSTGIRYESVNKDFVIPSKLHKSLLEVAQQFHDYVFYDTGKQTIFTLEGNNDITEAEFQDHKQEIVTSLETLVREYPELEVQADRLAINVRYKKANKRYATQKYLAWLQEKKLVPEKFYVFGDSPSDLEMGVELQSQQLPFEFVYVGESEELHKEKYTFFMHVTKGHCVDGTIEYLDSL